MIDTFTIVGLGYELRIDADNDITWAIVGVGNLIHQPQTNAMGNCVNGCISDWLATRLNRPGADALALHLAVQSPYSTEDAASSIIDCSDKGMAG